MKKILSLFMSLILIAPMTLSSFALTTNINEFRSSEGKYLVFYWLENADDDGYTFAGDTVESGNVGEDAEVPDGDPEDIQFPIDIRNYDGTLSNDRQFKYITRNADKTNSLNKDKKITSDGNTIVNVFYDRNVYTLEFELSDKRIPEVNKFKFKDKDEVYSFENPYKFTAKFEENISDKWPSSEKVDLLNKDENIIEDITLAGTKNYNDEYNFFYKHADKQHILNKELADNCEFEIIKAYKNENNQYEIKTFLEDIDLDNNFYEDDRYYNKSYEPTEDGFFTQFGIKGFTARIANRALIFNENYTRNRYNIDFYSDYNKLNNNKIQAKFEKSLEDIEKPDHGTKDGYNFEGWSVPEIIGDTVKFKVIDINKEKVPYNDLHLFAKWTKKSTGGGGSTVDPDPLPPVPAGRTVIIASGEKYTDVLTATVLGNEKNASILLSNKDHVTQETIEELKRLNTKDIIISGGEASVSQKVIDQLKDYNVTRIAGTDRYETAEKIGNEIRKTGNKDGAMLVDGTNFPDVITISSLASKKRVPILLTEPKDLNTTTKNTIGKWGVNNVTIGGSYNSVSKGIENNLSAYKVNRFGGVDRYETASFIGDEIRKSTGNKDDMILVDGTDFPDGITINSIASRYMSPIMLTNPRSITKITSDKIKEWSIENVLIAGGYNSVSKEIEDGLDLQNVERVAGKDRYETAVKIAQRLTELNKALGGKVINE